MPRKDALEKILDLATEVKEVQDDLYSNMDSCLQDLAVAREKVEDLIIELEDLLLEQW
ncbi:MAG: hypothetical protein JRJ69_10440 [Deltaproteobacteria bacterium]|nr:hypothetical protein [Deltaproteobacteria bacterium]